MATQADVRDLDALTAAVSDGVAELGRLDIVLANAGISTPAPTLEMDETVWDEMIEINLTGQWKTIRAAVPHIISGGRGGSVVITSSLAAIYANAHTAHYSAAKAGLIMLMKVLAKELAPDRIRVNTIHPTTVATDMILNEPTYRLIRPDLAHPTRADFEEAARTLNKLPVAAVEPADISNAVLYLVSDAGRYVTGTTHVVDAGGHAGPASMTSRTSALVGWMPRSVTVQVAPACSHGSVSSPGARSMTTSNGSPAGRSARMSLTISASSSGPGRPVGNKPSHFSARCTGRRCGHSPATHTGIRGRCTGSGSNSPDQYRVRSARPRSSSRAL
ncbi:MAG: SDR family oxidoreductase, partial [Streptosporangiaceae bacterium]